jgi:hypothetical protein
MFCRVTNEGVILMNLFMVQGHIGLMTYNYYCRWIQMIYHATMLRNLYVSVVYQLDREWCPPRLGFAHCRPIISVDGTFLTENYKGTLMVTIGMTVENHLLSLAFALVEGENNESWSWFLGHMRKQVLGPDR